MRERSLEAQKQLKTLGNNPYSSRSFQQIAGALEGVDLPKSAGRPAPASAVYFEKLYLDYRTTSLQIVEAKSDLANDFDVDSTQPYTAEQKAALRKQIAELTKEMKAQRAEAIKAYRALYKGTPTLLSSKIGRVAGGFAFAAAVPVLEIVKEPAKRLMCGFQSTATGEAMADIGAVAILSTEECRIDIPEDKLFELALRSEEELNSLPKPICTMVMAKLEALRDQQEKFRPNLTAEPTCRADGFIVPVNINGHTYTHEYSKRPDGAIELRASFLPTIGPGQSTLFKNIPGGAYRFSFRVNVLNSGATWSKLSTDLPQWNAFTAGSGLRDNGQGLQEAIKFSQTEDANVSPPTPQEARASVASSGAMTLNYVSSVGQQISAANRYLPEVLEFCAATSAAKPDAGAHNGPKRSDVKK